MRPIWKDYNVNINGIEPYVHFYVRESGDTEILYEGRADRMPNDHMYNQLFICANKVCQTLLDVKYPSATGVTLHSEAAKKFEFIDSDTQSIVRGEADFIYDWSYEDIEYGSNILSEPINGHLDPRMRMFCTMYNSGNTAIEIDGEQPPIPPEPTFVLILSGNTSFNYTQQNSNIYVVECTDWSGVTITKSGSWFNYTKTSTGVTLSISENTTSSGRSGSLYFYHNGTLHTTLSLTQAASASPYEQQYFTYEALSSGTINLTYEDSSSVSTPLSVSYRKNGGDWNTGTFGSTSVSVNAGDKVEFKGNNSAYIVRVVSGYTTYNIYNQFNTTAKCNIYGNIMSLVYGDNFIGNTGISSYAFHSLIRGSVISAEHLVLPATTLAYGCYYSMFRACTSLTTAPALPATTLGDFCYYSMFSGCTSLTTAPALPATTLTNGCYQYMFEGCASLVNAPALPATTLHNYCYAQMFHNCTSLTTAPELPATTLTYGCYNAMFYDCISLQTAPELPAITLTGSCYYEMFRGCTALNYVKCLAETFGTNSTRYWLYGVSATGTFVKKQGVTWESGASGIPNNWTVEEVA